MADGDVTVKTTITGTLTSGDAIRAYSESKTFASIQDIRDMFLDIPTSLVKVVEVGTVSGQTLSTLRCLALTNKDSTNFITIGILTSGDAVYLKLEAGESLVWMSSQIDANATGGAIATLASIDEINALADTAACVLEVKVF